MVFDAHGTRSWARTLQVDASLARVRGDVNVLAEGSDAAPRA
jgi:hypothetical protein